MDSEKISVTDAKSGLPVNGAAKIHLLSRSRITIITSIIVIITIIIIITTIQEGLALMY